MHKRIDRFCIKAKPFACYVGNKLCARLLCWIQKLFARLISTEVSLVLWSQKRRLVMIKPPRQFLRRGVLEVDNGVLIRIQQTLIKEVAGPMQQAGVIHFSSGVNSL